MAIPSWIPSFQPGWMQGKEPKNPEYGESRTQKAEFDNSLAIGPYPAGQTGDTIWFDQTERPDFQPWSNVGANSPYWGMPMYAGFSRVVAESWIPSYQPGLQPVDETWGFGLPTLFTNKQSVAYIQNIPVLEDTHNLWPGRRNR